MATHLSDILSQAAQAKKLSARSVARHAQELGHTINHDTAARYLRGDHGTPSEATLEALSAVLGVSMQRLRQAAGLPDELTTPYTPPPESSRLSRRQRRAVDEIIRAMLDPAGRRGAEASADGAGAAASRVRPAARRGKPEPPAAR